VTKNSKENVCYFGMINDNDQTKSFGILENDRKRHLYVLGKTGTGKSTMLHNMCLQDIYQGKGVCFIDPHGDSVEYILDRIPLKRKADLIYFNPADIEFPLGLNVLQAEKDEQIFLIASGLMSVFKRIWAGMWSSRMEYILNNTLLALLEQHDKTLLSVVRMLSDERYAKDIVAKTTNPMVKNFWTREYANYHEKYRQEAVSPILNKIGQFFSTELIRNILGQKQSSFNIRDVIDGKKILLVNLSKGRLGEDNSNLLGSLLVTKIQLAAMSRVDMNEDDRSNFCLYVDEFQNFTTDSFSSILSEARKYGLNLVLAHQYVDQLSETGNENVKNAIFGNVGSLVIFQVGAKDADRLVAEFEPIFNRQTLVNLDKTEIAVRLSIDGRTSQPFLAKTMPPIFDGFKGKKNIMIATSRQKFGRSKTITNEEINRYFVDDQSQQSRNSRQKQLKKYS
jgi:hypothetical protein